MNLFPIEKLSDIPKSNLIRSVYLLPFTEDGKLVITKNERGWDVIGGHIEPIDESVLDGLKRESLEEASVVFHNIQAFAALQFSGNDDFMVFYVSNDIEIKKVTEHYNDVYGRDVVSIDEFISKYYGDKSLMQKIITLAIMHI